jgi:hypothetical protein
VVTNVRSPPTIAPLDRTNPWDSHERGGTLKRPSPNRATKVLEEVMTVDERNRLQLAEAAKRILGDDEGITLMELLPPVGWADVATKQDLAALEGRIDARFDRVDARFDRVDARFDTVDARFASLDQRFELMEHKVLGTMERGLRQLTWRLFAIYGATMTAMVGAVVAVAKL